MLVPEAPAAAGLRIANVVKSGRAAVRAEYTLRVQALAGRVEQMRAAGKGAEEIARTVHAERRALGVVYKEMTDPVGRAIVYARNLKKYGDKLGPTIEWLRTTGGKTWDDIIEGASRVGGGDLGL